MQVFTGYVFICAVCTNFVSGYIQYMCSNIQIGKTYTVKNVTVFPVPSRDFLLTKLSLAGNNLIIPGQGELGK